MIQLETITPAALAKQLGWAEKRVRSLAKRLGSCRILGNRMVLTREDVDTILEATKPCPSKSIGVKDIKSGSTGARLPEIDYVDRLAQRAEKSRRELRPRSKTDIGNVTLMVPRTR